MYRLEELEKIGKDACEKNDYENYRKAVCLLHAYVNTCPEYLAERACFILYDLLTTPKSSLFLLIVSNLKEKESELSTMADTMLLALLLSVRVKSDLMSEACIEICQDIFNEAMEECQVEKRE